MPKLKGVLLLPAALDGDPEAVVLPEALAVAMFWTNPVTAADDDDEVDSAVSDTAELLSAWWPSLDSVVDEDLAWVWVWDFESDFDEDVEADDDDDDVLVAEEEDEDEDFLSGVLSSNPELS